jgi:hypothetical protein
MAVIPQTFRGAFPEFKDPGVYTDAAINLLITLAGNLMNPDRWDSTIIDYGTQLFIAHNLALDQRNLRSARFGGTPGSVPGVLTQKAVDKVSASYDVASVTLADGGFWNMTIYGIRFLELARMMGSGGLQIGNC